MSERVRHRERFKLSLAVFVFLIQDGRLLFLLRKDTGWMDGQFSVPGGLKEPGETLPVAALREAKEEVGVTIQAEDLLLTHVMHNFTTGQEWIGSFFLVHKWDGEPELREPHRHDQMRWFDPENLPENVSPYVRQAIRHYREQSGYSEFGWEVAENADELAYLHIGIQHPKGRDES